MAEIGAYEAKTHLPRLLKRVARGEQITITRHGVPVARLVPAQPIGMESRQEAIEELRAFRKGRKLGRLSVRRMIEEGRRF